jgi:DNA (cytosine-5)-methyltransferase 1
MDLKNIEISAIDLFCGIGGLSYGLKKSGIKVKAGIDIDETCGFSYTKNNKADFILQDVSEIKGEDLLNKYWGNISEIKILVGCAPCQPFSTHSNKKKDKKNDPKWNLIKQFQRLIEETHPEIVSMENVPNLANQKVFQEYYDFLMENNYYVYFEKVFLPNYGLPQKRRRLVLLASKLGEIKLIPHTHTPNNYKTTKEAIGFLPKVKAGEIHKDDPLHRTTKLSPVNIERIKSSKPNGSWLDWDENLRLVCHKKSSGQTYKSVYGRMSWDEPSPTITTQFYNYGTGRFGHPEQDRALTIREAALLQTFPKDYIFYKNEEDVKLTKVGVHIGNAVPVDLGYVIGKSIQQHLKDL